MQITKHNNNTNISNTINFIQLIKELELSTGYKSNKRRINYRLLNNESITLNQYTYFKNKGGF